MATKIQGNVRPLLGQIDWLGASVTRDGEIDRIVESIEVCFKRNSFKYAIDFSRDDLNKQSFRLENKTIFPCDFDANQSCREVSAIVHLTTKPLELSREIQAKIKIQIKCLTENLMNGNDVRVIFENDSNGIHAYLARIDSPLPKEIDERVIEILYEALQEYNLLSELELSQISCDPNILRLRDLIGRIVTILTYEEKSAIYNDHTTLLLKLEDDSCCDLAKRLDMKIGTIISAYARWLVESFVDVKLHEKNRPMISSIVCSLQRAFN